MMMMDESVEVSVQVMSLEDYLIWCSVGQMVIV